MKWGKVLGKFVKGFITGGIGAIVPQIPDIVTGSAGVDLQGGTVIALVVAVCNAFANWFKHRAD